MDEISQDLIATPCETPLQEERMCSKWPGSLQIPHLTSSLFPHVMRLVGVGNRSYVERMVNWSRMGSIFQSVFHVNFLVTALSHFIQAPWGAMPTAFAIRFSSSIFRNSSVTIFLFSLQSAVSHLLFRLLQLYFYSNQYVEPANPDEHRRPDATGGCGHGRHWKPSCHIWRQRPQCQEEWLVYLWYR